MLAALSLCYVQTYTATDEYHGKCFESCKTLGESYFHNLDPLHSHG